MGNVGVAAVITVVATSVAVLAIGGAVALGIRMRGEPRADDPGGHQRRWKVHLGQSVFWILSSVWWFVAAATEDGSWRWVLAALWLLTGVLWGQQAWLERRRAAAARQDASPGVET